MSRKGWALLVLGAFVLGCGQARRYSPEATEPSVDPAGTPAAKEDKPDPTKRIDPRVQWLPGDPPSGDPPILFIHAGTQPKKWAELKAFWNDSLGDQARGAAALIGLPPLAAGVGAGAGTGKDDRVIRIKVPRGLADPTLYVPAANPMSLRKWELGRRLFFADNYLDAKPGTSCAGCHRPERGYTDGLSHAGRDTPTLINSAFNRFQFWDGRVGSLEEVVQRTLEDERVPAQADEAPFRHVWHGVVNRLRDDPELSRAFYETFGNPATQDTVGKALACYLRTLLSGDSLYDRAAEAARPRGETARPTREDYEKLLDEAALRSLVRPGDDKGKVADALVRGEALFRGPAGCLHCHLGPRFSDGQFHNVGMGPPVPLVPMGGEDLGRFAAVPVGLKQGTLIGAYKTPSLRSLSRTGPYGHDGRLTGLVDVLHHYNEMRAGIHLYLDPLVSGKAAVLTDPEAEDVVLFLRALNGGEVAPEVRSRPPKPDEGE